MVNRKTRRTGIQVGARCENQFPTQGVELLFGSARFQYPSTNPDHHPLKHGSNQLRIGRERVAGGLQHSHDRLIESESQLLHDLGSVHVGAYGVESDTRLRIAHLGFKKCGDHSCPHLLETLPFLFAAGSFDCFDNLIEVPLQGSLQQRTLVREILIQGSN
jgi:hypothetical protein